MPINYFMKSLQVTLWKENQHLKYTKQN
jgi:hypothetical protein